MTGHTPHPPRCYPDRKTKKVRCKWAELVGNDPCPEGTCRAAYNEVRPESLDDYAAIHARGDDEKGRYWRKAAPLMDKPPAE